MYRPPIPSEIIKSEKTSSAEALRLIRTNLEFMLTKVSDGIAKTIFDLYFLTKERLLFRQILRRLSHCQVKVLLIGMDFRNPRLNEYMVVQRAGITNYLSSNDLDLKPEVKHDGYKISTCQRVLYHLILQSY
jgi:Mrp family chromosome partitioning ATPase